MMDQEFAGKGVVAQLEERLHGMQEVVGSNPIFSTKFASVTQTVECQFEKLKVTGSIPV